MGHTESDPLQHFPGGPQGREARRRGLDAKGRRKRALPGKMVCAGGRRGGEGVREPLLRGGCGGLMGAAKAGGCSGKAGVGP